MFHFLTFVFFYLQNSLGNIRCCIVLNCVLHESHIILQLCIPIPFEFKIQVIPQNRHKLINYNPPYNLFYQYYFHYLFLFPNFYKLYCLLATIFLNFLFQHFHLSNYQLDFIFPYFHFSKNQFVFVFQHFTLSKHQFHFSFI